MEDPHAPAFQGPVEMDIRFEFEVIRSKRRRKTISLRVKEDGKVVVHSPWRTPKGEIEKWVNERGSWIAKTLSRIEKKKKEAEKRFQHGEKFLYLGEWYPLEIREGSNGETPLTLSFGAFVLGKDRSREARDLFVKWYKKEAKKKITERIYFYSHRLHLFPKGIRITSARFRWGSCSPENRLSFSWKIIMAPMTVLDYVLLHELAHIKEKNHSIRFWSYLESILPECKKQRHWLKVNGHLLKV